MKESQYSVEPNRARHLSIWLLRCWCYKAGESTGTQMHEPGDIWSLSITIRSHLYPHRAFHTSSISSTGSPQCTYSLFETWRACMQKEMVKETSFVENIWTLSPWPQVVDAATMCQQLSLISISLMLEQRLYSTEWTEGKTSSQLHY